MRTLITGMGPALHSISKLTLNVTHQRIDLVESREAFEARTRAELDVLVKRLFARQGHSRHDSATTATTGPLTSANLGQTQRVLYINPCPPGLGAVLRGVFSILAEAVPCLCELSLCGFCWDAALDAFGASCPQLTTLHVQCPQVPIQALQNLGKRLPNLSNATVTCVDDGTASEQQRGEYADAYLLEIQHCLSLKKLRIDFGHQARLACKPGSWDLVPASVQQLECTSAVAASQPFYSLVSRVQSLSLRDTPAVTFGELLQQFPLLRAFTTASTTPIIVMCGDQESTFDQLFLRQKLLDGFRLDCHSMLFAGGSDQHIRELFLWLPQFPSVDEVTISFKGKVAGNCLEQVSRLFPGLASVTLAENPTGLDNSSGPVLDSRFLATLAGCMNLQVLRVCFPVRLSTSDVLQLCTSLPKLLSLSFVHCGVEKDELEAELHKLGRQISIKVLGFNS